MVKKSLLFCLIISLVLILGCKNEVINDTAVMDDAIHGEEVMEAEKEDFPGTQMITYGSNYQGYLVKPEAQGKFPAVVMIHEWWGLNQNIKNMAHDLAKEGYAVLAVDLFDGKVADTPEKAREYTTEVRNNQEKAISHMKSAVAFLKEQDYVSDEEIASMGWCFGGGMSLQLALNDELAATVIYYGNLETNTSKLSSIEWPVLGIFGEQDTGIPPEEVRKFESSLNQLNIENEIYIYDGVGHAFANPSNAGHDPEKTKDAWSKTISFLNKNLKN